MLAIAFVNLLIARLKDEKFGCNTGFGDIGHLSETNGVLAITYQESSKCSNA